MNKFGEKNFETGKSSSKDEYDDDFDDDDIDELLPSDDDQLKIDDDHPGEAS